MNPLDHDTLAHPVSDSQHLVVEPEGEAPPDHAKYSVAHLVELCVTPCNPGGHTCSVIILSNQ